MILCATLNALLRLKAGVAQEEIIKALQFVLQNVGMVNSQLMKNVMQVFMKDAHLTALQIFQTSPAQVETPPHLLSVFEIQFLNQKTYPNQLKHPL